MSDREALSEAARSAEDAASRDPRNVHALSHAAASWLRAGDLRRAFDCAEGAVALAPAQFAILRSSSGVAAACGMRDRAVEWGSAAVAMRPDDGEARFHLAGLLGAAGDWRGAAGHLLAHVGSAKSTPAGWRMLSTALSQMGRFDKALEAIDQALLQAPNEMEFRIHRASLLGSRGRSGDALDELGIAREQDPSDARIWRASSGIREVLGELPQALADAERAVELAPGDEAIRSHLAHVAALTSVDLVSRPVTVDAAAWMGNRGRPKRERMHVKRRGVLARRWDVVWALMRRDMRSRYGATRLGYVWAVVEPMAHLATLGSAFATLNHSPPPIGDSLFLFYLTGILPFLMFSHVSGEIMSALGGAGGVLQLPAVRTTDVIASKALLGLSTEIVVGVLAFSAAAALGERGWPAHPLQAMAGILALWLLAMGIGAVNLTVSGLFPAWEFVYQAVLRLMYFASGIYYSPIAMPSQVREILAWNPVLQGIDLFRSGFYPQYEPHWLDVPYLAAWCLGVILIGFSGERALRSKLAAAR